MTINQLGVISDTKCQQGKPSFTKRVLAEVMATSNERLCLAFLLTALMVFSTLSLFMQPNEPTEEIEEIETIDSTTGRQPTADCEGISFEDMFYYNYAEFTVQINDEWDGGYVRAKAMVNGTDTTTLRNDLDGLFEGLAGGANGWLSTDEKDGVEAVGKDCVVQTYTRIGFRGGPSHRGGPGVNWNNATWIKDGMTLEETNLIPEGHPERRSCKDQFGGPSGSPTCEEIPNEPANAGQCGPHSCDTIIFLNASVSFSQIIDPSDFTLAMVGRNLTNAQFEYIFPNQASPLRIADTYENQDCNETYYEDDEEADDYQVTYTAREECQSYTNLGDLDYSLTAVNDGTSFSRRFTYDPADWPAARGYFIDFTTSPPEVDNPPVWNDDAPGEGELLPVAAVGESEYVVDLADINAWFDDDLGAGMLNVDCTGAAGWSLAEAEANHWMVTSPSDGTTTTISCEAIDSSGQSSGARTFSVAPIFSVSVASATSLDDLTFTMTPTSEAPDSMSVSITLMQNNVEVSDSMSMDTSAANMVLSLSTLIPGTVSAKISANGAGMAPFEYNYDLGLAKLSLPPSVTITGGEWVSANYILRGQFFDPDGEAVSFTLKLDGVQAGQVTVTGNQWVTDEIPFDLLIEGVHNVTIEACDNSGVCVSVSEDVDNTFLFEVIDDVISDTSKPAVEESGLPAASIGLTMMALLGAGIAVSRRRD
uniref:Uncharacterized protein n=2 Tax=environmental samples TaxID=68359 RepID=A0A075HSQ7_9EURY|nr:hypothetical protein [uncultured marine group II/III euryarchaeote KM3_83_B05]